MSFFDHLDELRARLTRCLAVFFTGFIACYFTVVDPVMEFLRKPLFEVLPEAHRKLYFTHLFENFLTHLKIAGYVAFFLLMPYFFLELWGFIAPGLYPKERKWVMPFLGAASIFFMGGAGFAYFVLFPVGFKFFVTYGLPTDFALLTIEAYYTTCLRLLLVFGLAFEMPVILSLLGLLGLVDAEFLRQQRRNAVFGITIACALFAPPDAISMLILMAPLILLYEGAILVVQWIGLKRRQMKEAS